MNTSGITVREIPLSAALVSHVQLLVPAFNAVIIYERRHSAGNRTSMSWLHLGLVALALHHVNGLNLGDLSLPSSRRAALAVAAAACTGRPQLAWASYGDSALQAPPALVPSPIRPTGPMADTCEVVALGREDVCLEPKKLISSYEKLLLSKADDNLADACGQPELDAGLLSLLQSVRRQIILVEANDFSELTAELERLNAAATSRCLSALAVGNDDLSKRAQTVSASLSSLATSAKKREASPAAKTLVKLAADLCTFAG